MYNNDIYSAVSLKRMKNKNVKESFNRRLYNPENDYCEYNSGEVKVDCTGYVPLRSLLERCGLSLPPSNWPTLDLKGTNKFSDTFDSLELSKQIIEKYNNNNNNNSNNNNNNEFSNTISKTVEEGGDHVDKNE